MDPFGRATASFDTALPWLVELATAPVGRPGVCGGIDRRLRAEVAARVAAEMGDRHSLAVHRATTAFTGPPPPGELTEVAVEYARRSVRGGRPADPRLLTRAGETPVARSVRSTVALAALAALAGNSLDGLVARATGSRPFHPARIVSEATAVALATPWWLVGRTWVNLVEVLDRLVPPVPEPVTGDDPHLLTVAVSEAVPHLLGSVPGRVAVQAPISWSVAFRAGPLATTLRAGRGAVEVVDGIDTTAFVVIEGDLDDVIEVVSGALVGDIARLRVSRP